MVFEIGCLFDFLVLICPKVLELLVELLLLLLMDVLVGELLLGKLGRGEGRPEVWEGCPGAGGTMPIIWFGGGYGGMV